MLQCTGWEDDPEDLPLTYHWYAESKRVLHGAVKTNWVEIGMALPLSLLTATLTAGSRDDGYSRVVAVYITDAWGAQTRVEITVPFSAPSASLWHGGYAPLNAANDRIDALFTQLAASVDLADIAAVSQTALRITEALDAAAITAVQNAEYRTQLLAVVRSVAEMLSLSQDARRAVAALDGVGAEPDSGSSEASGEIHNAFLTMSGYSEVAIELLTQLCGDGAHLSGSARTEALQFLIGQTSSLASLDAFSGMQTATADSALVATHVILDSFVADIAAVNHNTTMPAAGSAAANTTAGAHMLALRAEVDAVINIVAQQLNVLAMGALARQAVGQDATAVSFGGISVVSQGVSTLHSPSSMAAKMPNAAGDDKPARMTMPSSIHALNASALQVVMAMVKESSLFHLAGLESESYLNSSQSSPLISFTVFNRALADVDEMTVGDNVTVPAQQPIKFNLAGSGTGGYIIPGLPFATLAASEGEFFTLEVPHPAPAWPDVNFVCEWWDANDNGVGGKWSNAGCELVAVADNNRTTTCRCTHLTLFRVRLDFNNFLPKFNTLDADDFKNLTWANIHAHPLPLITCGVWFGVYLVFAFIAALIDRRKDARALRHYHGEWSDPQRKQWDAVTGDTSASLPSSAMLNPDAGVEKMAFTERWIDLYKHLMKHDHLWLSVILRYDTNAFSSVGRVTAGFVLVLTGYMINALFFGSSNGSVGFSTFVTSIISAAILIPVGVLISLLFGRSQQGRLKSAIYGYAEHVAQLKYTNRISESQFATRNEHHMKRNPVISDEDERVLLHSIAQAGGWTHGPGNALIPDNARGIRDERELRNQLRLLVHIDYDLFMVWFRESWSFPLGLRLFGFVLLWIYVIVLALLIIVYGIQLDRNNSDNTKEWLQASAISNVIEIFAMKPVTIFVKAFMLLVLSFCFCSGKPKGPASKSTPDDNLTVYSAIEMFAGSGAGRGHKHVATDLELDTGGANERDGAVAVLVAGAGAGAGAAGPYGDNYDTAYNGFHNGNNNAAFNSSAIPHSSSSWHGATASAPAAIEMTPIGPRSNARTGNDGYAPVHSLPSSPAINTHGLAYNDDSSNSNNTNDNVADDWNTSAASADAAASAAAAATLVSISNAPPASAQTSSFSVLPPPMPRSAAASVSAPPPLPRSAAASVSASAFATSPPPPPLPRSAAVSMSGAAGGPPLPPPVYMSATPSGGLTSSVTSNDTADYDPSRAPVVPALPAPTGGLPVMSTRSTQAYQQREAAVSQSAQRAPMPLPNHIPNEYALSRTSDGVNNINHGQQQ